MVIEDADNNQRIAAFNLLNIINISTGIITPLAGILVKLLGVANAERIFIVFAIISMTAMMLIRNRYYTETKIGSEILANHKGKKFRDIFKSGIYGKAFSALKKNSKALMVMCILILFNIYLPIGTYSSLYFAPYMTEVLKIDKSTIAILGGVNSAVMLFVFVFVNPVISKYNKLLTMIVGLLIQSISLFLLTVIPPSSLSITIACVALFAIGFSIFRPFIDAVFAEVTEGNERAGIYSLFNTITSILSALIGLVSGFLYVLNPRLLYIISIIILFSCIALLAMLIRFFKKL